MAKCKYCGKGGWFSSTDSAGLCQNCAPVVRMAMANEIRIIADSFQLIATSEKVVVVTGRIQTLRDALQRLQAYENKKIKIDDFSAASALQEIEEKHDKWILSAIDRELSKVIHATLEAKTIKGKMNKLLKFQEALKTYKSSLKNPELASKIETKITKLISQTPNL